MQPQESHRGAGALCVAIAAALVILALTDPTLGTERQWMVGACAGAFFLAGLQLLLRATGRLAAALGAVTCWLFVALGLGVAFSSRPVSINVPFLPETWGQFLGHALFGIVTLIPLALAVHLTRQAFRRRGPSAGPSPDQPS